MPQGQRDRLFLIDGMSQVYRAYYAIRGLATSSGIPTNAIYGFTMMLRRLIADEKPHYLGVVFDTAHPTFRHEQYEQYKATRTKMPDDLSIQMPYVDRLCDALRLPTVRMPGFEADDIIGTLVKLAEEQGLDVVVVTNDKDMSQLVNEHVRLLKTDRMGNAVMMDAKAVEEKFGVRPDQIVDLLGLWGDTIDNIPGAPGVGEKGAKQLIQTYGTIENTLAHAGEITRKAYRESLQNNVDLIRQSRELVTIKCDMDIQLDLEGLRFGEPDRKSAYNLFLELEFAQLTKEYLDSAPELKAEAALAAPVTNYRAVKTRAELDRLIEQIWSVESIGLAAAERAGRVTGIAVSLRPSESALIDLDQFEAGSDPLQSLKAVFENGLVAKSIHDWKGFLTALERRACPPEALLSGDGCIEAFKPVHRIDGVQDDTMLAAYLLDPNRSAFRVGDLAREHLGVQMQDVVESFHPDDSRALQTADFSNQLAAPLGAMLEKYELGPVYRDIEMPLVNILFDMEQAGVRIDIPGLDQAGREMEKEIARLTADIYAQAGKEFNINSSQQLGEIFEDLNFDVGRKTKTGRISTSVDVLEELATKYELPKRIIEYREITKLKNTYVDALPRLIDPRTGRVHTTLNQAVAATGRLSSTNPNLQNIPIRSELGRRIRAAFIPSPGYQLMSADYSQIELRILAHITGDPVMTEAFNQGEDIHARTARLVFGAQNKQEESDNRRLAKIVNFAIAYAIGPFGLAARTGLSRAEAKAVIENYYKTYAGVRRYMEQTPIDVRQTGWVRTIFGRIRPIPDIANRNHNLRARAEREAINAPIQGTAADLVKMAMIRVYERLAREHLGARMMLQVHDELVLEVPEAEAEQTREVVRFEMESVYPLSVPLVVDIGMGKNWMEAKP